VIAVDSSALVAIAFNEPDRSQHLSVLLGSSETLISQINYVETGILLVTRGLLRDPTSVDIWMKQLGIEVADVEIAAPALEGYLRYGKGIHPARLNLADAFAYALAKHLGAPLLYKGDDFALTDVRSALQPT
jgi:ribonuclease VapC